mmetsp:Transcript_40705/g.83524  ORF Transcript_40705/g.83524 Transcript_40705/m.83524 type:complete len:225 (-) Transcript_40705:41-715(-)
MARFASALCALALGSLGWRLGPLGSLGSRAAGAFVGNRRRLDLCPFSARCTSRDRRDRQGRGAAGHFPAREDLDVSPPNRQALLERLQQELPASNVEEHTEEVRLLRDQTALLAQELRLLREVLQEGSLLSQIENQQANGLSQEHGTLAAPAVVAEPQPKRVAGTPAATAATARLQFRDTQTSGGQAAAFRAPEALESLAHLSARVVERRRNGELPLGQVPSIG